MASLSGSPSGWSSDSTSGGISWSISGLEYPSYQYGGFEVWTSDGQVSSSTSPSLYTSGHACGDSVSGDAYALWDGTWYSAGSASVSLPSCPVPDPPDPTDTTPPYITGSRVQNLTDSSATYVVAANDDQSGVVLMELYRDGVLYGSVGASNNQEVSITYNGLAPSTSYTFGAIAGDAYLNYSPFSSITVTTLRALPSPLTGLAWQAINATTIHLTWDASANASHYRVVYGSVDTTTPGTSYTMTGLTPNTIYFTTVYPVNVDNQQGQGATVSASTRPRPANFAWVYTNISTGQRAVVDSRDWNNLGAKINEFRDYKARTALSFTTAYSGNQVLASMYNEMADAISLLSPPTPAPGTVGSGSGITNARLAALRDSLNSIP